MDILEDVHGLHDVKRWAEKSWTVRVSQGSGSDSSSTGLRGSSSCGISLSFVSGEVAVTSALPLPNRSRRL